MDSLLGGDYTLPDGAWPSACLRSEPMSTVRSDIPARLDRLPWSAWHWRVVIALGVSWLLDGLEVTVVGSLGPALQRDDTLGLTASQIGWAASAYIAGAVLGALVFGRLADRLGRKRMFLATLIVYLVATVATAFSWDILSFAVCRFFTGFGIGGDLAVAILLVRRHVPESPRWLLTHGRVEEAEAVIRDIEAKVGVTDKVEAHLSMRALRSVSWGEVLHVLLVRHRRRAVLGLTLMASQAFFYNAIFFTYALMLTRFYGIPEERVGFYIFPFAVGNFLGPLVLGRLFDAIGRRKMIALTYSISGIMLIATAYAFSRGWLTAFGQTLCWSAIFFVASAAASSAYLTVSEVFPL